MPYKVGVSSGWWHIDKPADLLGLATKVGGFGATAGVQFIQADVETTSEFFEPRVGTYLKRLKSELGLQVGVHAEIGELMALESAERRFWDQSQLRLCETVKHAADLGLVYINLHLSSRPQLYYMEREYRVMGYVHPVVDFKGEALFDICEKSKKAKELAKKNLLGASSIIHMDDRERYEYVMGEQYRQREDAIAEKRVPDVIAEIRKTQQWKDARPEDRAVMERETAVDERRRIHDEIVRTSEHEQVENLYQLWKRAPNARYQIETAEIAVYKIIGAYMQDIGDPIWKALCGNNDAETAYIKPELHPNFNAAVAAKYLEGHLTARNHPFNRQIFGKNISIMDYLKDKNTALVFEIPEAHAGTEGLLRLYKPLDAYHWIKKMNTEKIKLCIDFEHAIAHKINIDDMLMKMPSDMGKMMMLFHLGKPIPYFGTAHAPIPIGSRTMEILYKWLYEFRKKGFKDGYIIYERGGGKTAEEIMKNAVWSMRQISRYLEQGVPYEDLPPEFYGISEQNREIFARQAASVRDHAWDPLEGVLSVPEERHGHFSKAAVDKQKGEVWEKRKYR